LWSGGSFGATASCLITADDRLIVWADQGTLTLVETAGRSSEKYLQLAQLDRMFRTDVWPHIALSDGRLYCKDRDGNLKCLQLGR